MANTTLTVNAATLEELKLYKRALRVESLDEVIWFLARSHKTRRGPDWAHRMVARQKLERGGEKKK
jgi:hypothetical protein